MVWWLRGLCTVTALLVFVAAVHAATAPGTVLYNQASVSYLDAGSGQWRTLLSNTAAIVVAAQPALALDGDKTRRQGAGQPVSIGHTLTNTGNVTDSYTLTVSNLSGDDGDLADLAVYQDSNGNGQVDAGEPLMATTPPLAPGASVSLVVSGRSSSGQNKDDRVRVVLTALSRNSATANDSATDTLRIGSGASINLSKSSSASCGVPLSGGDTFDYRIAFTNSGSAAPATRTVLVDNQSLTGVLVEDELPANIQVIAGSGARIAPVQAELVAHRAGDADDVWRRFSAIADTAGLDRLALLVPAAHLRANQSGGFGFSVRVNHGVTGGTMIYNRAAIDTDGDGRREFTSNQVCNTLAGAAAPTLGFLQPSSALLQSGGVPHHGTDSDFQTAAIYALLPENQTSVLRDGVFLQLNASQLNLSSLQSDYLEKTATGERLLAVTLSSSGSGDTLQVAMLETGANTGVFRSLYPVLLSDARNGAGATCPGTATVNNPAPFTAATTTADAIAAGCVLRSHAADRLTVSFRVPLYGAGGVITGYRSVNAEASVDPKGTVFDAANGKPLNGVGVMLYQSKKPFADTHASECADLATSDYWPAARRHDGQPISKQHSGGNGLAAGRYGFSSAEPGYCYYLEVTPPAGYTFPSVVAPHDAGGAAYQVTQASYGLEGYQGLARASHGHAGAFLLSGGMSFADIPLDSISSGGDGQLVIEKSAHRDDAAVGDVVGYTVSVSNHHGGVLYALRVDDKPPYGFRYVKGSAWLELNDQRIRLADPLGGTPLGGTPLAFRFKRPDGSAINLDAGAKATLHYALRLSAAAVDGHGINRATAYGNTDAGFTLTSNQDQATITIRDDGVLSGQAMIFGKVYVDADCNNLQNDGEWPIGGVKLYLQDGTWVITDENGQFSVYALRAGMHTLKVDPLTLPGGVVLKPTSNRQAGDPGSAFVDLLPGEYHRVDFAAQCPQPEQAAALYQALKARNANMDGTWMLDQAARFNPLSGGHDTRQQQADSSGDLGSGVYTRTGDGAVAKTWQRIAQGSAPGAATPVATPAAMANTQAVAARITRAQAEAGTWLWPQDGISRDGRFQAVLRANLAPTLYVNGQVVAESHIGERVKNRRERAQVVSWYGVTLHEGKNRLAIKALDPFGNPRVLAEGTFIKPGPATGLVIETDRATLPADGGRSTLALHLKLLDAAGKPARGDYFATLETERGQWLEADLQPDTPGQQVKLTDGAAVAHLRSSDYTGPVRVQARVDDLRAETRIEQVAPLRPLVATGFVQLTQRAGGHRDLNGAGPDTGLEGLDQQATQARGAVFVKGRIAGDAHLTLAYDTDKDLATEDQIRRDLNPASGYPIAGDASVRGYDARSHSKLYAKVEKGRSSLMWGDYLTDAGSDFFDLGRTQRTLTGINGVFDDGRTRARLFAARPDQQQVVEEIRGNGTAMLYTLGNEPVRDSETVELVTRDRDNPGLVIESKPLTRYVDYSVNYFTGDLRFAAVVPSVDDDLNPVYVRVSYNVAGDADSYLVWGARVRRNITERFAVGASHTRDHNDTDGYTLSSAAAEYKIGAATRLHASTATMSHDDGAPDGAAYSLAVAQQWENGSRTDLRWAHAGTGFDNPSAGISEAREELRLEHEQNISRSLSVAVAGVRSKQLDGDDTQQSLGVTGEKRIGQTTLSLGGRAIEQKDDSGTERFGTYILGAHQAMSLFGRPFQVGGEYERAYSDSDRRRIAADANLRITGKTDLYGRYEVINSLAGSTGLNSDQQTKRFTLGVKSALTRNTDVYSEYRMRGAMNGRDVAAANGVKSDIAVQPGLTFTPSLEWVDTLQGDGSGNATAVSLAMEDKRDKNRRTLGRVETRFGEDRTYYGLSAANIWRVNTDWSAVVRDDLALQLFDHAARQGDHIVTLGLARRPRRDNRHHLLFMYRWKQEWAGDDGYDRTVNMISTHHNYQVTDHLVLSGRLGGKWQSTDLGGQSVRTDAYVADGRVIWDITRRFDLDLHGGLLATDHVSEQRYSFGMAVNVLVRRNLRLGVGYNVAGFSDNDLDPQGYNLAGLYIGLEYKFDEDDLGWLASKAAGQRSYLGDTP